MIKSDILAKFDIKPGLCTIDELKDIKQFFEEYSVYRDIYRNVHQIDPVGETLETQLDKVFWYMNRK